MNAPRGRWIALEGGEGSGKSTQARLLADALGAVLTREPGGTRLGARLRELLLEPSGGSIEARTEALLMAADRAAHVSEVVRPALDRGQHVVSDRSAYSFLAYQGFGRGLSMDDLRQITDWATSGLWPDLVVLLDVPAELVAARWRVAGKRPDRVEAAGDGFHARVRDGFAEMATADPERWTIVDGTGEPGEVGARVGEAWVAFLRRQTHG